MKHFASFALVLLFSIPSFSQTQPTLENGWKPYGSYDGSHLDTVNLMNGNLMLHAPLVPQSPQRGALSMQSTLFVSSKDWQMVCVPDSTKPTGERCNWLKGGTGVNILFSPYLLVHRTLDKSSSGTGVTTYQALRYTIANADGSTHRLHPVAGTQDSSGEATQFDSIDLSGYHLTVSNPDANGVVQQMAVSDRAGNLYTGAFGPYTGCGHPVTNRISSSSGYQPIIDDAPFGDQYCSQSGIASLVTDTNGNQISLNTPINPNPTIDTLDKAPQLSGGAATTDFHDCGVAHTISSAIIYYYQAPDGTTQQIKACWAEITIQTAFNATGPNNTPVAEAATATGFHFVPIVTVVLGNGSKWTFDYDNYGELSSVGLPTGGSISYAWTTISFVNCSPVDPTNVSRAVISRTLNDGRGHTAQWQYHWGSFANNTLGNYVTDQLLNDTVHTFTQQGNTTNLTAGCNLYETTTVQYQGSQNANQLLQRIDTTYSSATLTVDDGTANSNALGNVFATDIQITIYPGGKIKKVHRDPDPGLGAGLPVFGNVTRELDYDWGTNGPGALLRETDTVYQWQKDARYLTARLLDLPASEVVVSPNGTDNVKSGCPLTLTTTGPCMAETDYFYDEPGYLFNPVPAISTQHVAPPAGVRGNQTTVSRWLSTAGSFISSHTKWYDTGEPYQKLDALGHTTTLTYDSAYAGAYLTQTCSPQTSNGSVTHCVSGTYDFNTGVLTHFTNENATAQAAGTVPGDSAHTISYLYDLLFRPVKSIAPPDPDPANGGAQAQTSVSYSDLTAPSSFPITSTIEKSVTTALSDSATSNYDGLGRIYKTQHAMPSGNPATVDTTFDQVGRVASVSNAYYSSSDATYGTTATTYDALDRPLLLTEQDFSVKKFTYSGSNCMGTTDEAGKQRQSCSDGLGRLVEVDEPSGAPVPNQNDYATMQTDGNFVIYNPQGTPLWASGTAGSGGSSIEIQDDGNFVLYIEKWQAGTYATPSPGPFPVQTCSIGTALNTSQTIQSNQCIVSPHGQYMLYMAPNGNFYIYDIAHNVATWSANTYNHPGAYAVMQGDGNFCVYAADGTFLWMSGTNGTSAERLEMEDDGRIIIFRSAWSSGTSQGWSTTSMVHPACDVGYGTGWTGTLGTGQCFVSPNGRYEVLMQTDGDLGLYDLSTTPTTLVWDTKTALSPVDPSVALRTLYFYDPLGNLTCVEQHGGVSGTGCSAAPSSDATSPWRVRRFTYDSLGRLLSSSNPESNTAYDASGNPFRAPTTYSYDADGNLLQKTSPAPNQTGSATQTISYCYDELHRVLAKGYSASPNPPQQCLAAFPWLPNPAATYSYDSGPNAKGKLTGVTDQAGSASYTYDVLGRLTSETRTTAGISKSISYDYNLNGSLKTLHYPSGRTVTYAPDSAGGIVSAADGNGTQYVSSATYYASGAEYQRNMPGIYFRTDLNPRLQVSAFYSNNGQVGQSFIDKSYSYGAVHQNNGNVISITNNKDATRTQTFSYDVLNRIASGSSAASSGALSWGETYSIDAWGNLMIAPMTGKTHGGLFQHAGDFNNRATGLGYDAAGNLTNYSAPGQYVYDPEDRIQSTAGVTYTYDADGNRVERSGGTASTLYWYGGPGIIAESDLSGTLKSEYVFFNGKRLARIDLPAGTVHYYLSDHLNSTSMVISGAGAVEDESDYSPFGTEYVLASSGLNHYKFTSKERDSESGLDYFGARYYSNGLGRFITPDWAAKATAVPYAEFADPQSLNLFSYVRNVPTSRYDADGHFQSAQDGCQAQQQVNNFKTKPDNLGPTIMGFLKQTINNLFNPLSVITGGQVSANFPIQGEDEHVGANASNQLMAAAPVASEIKVSSEIVDVSAMVKAPSVIQGSAAVEQGSFSIIDWRGYPENLPQPSGPFRLISGPEYEAARDAANSANKAMHAADPGLKGMHIHEIQPVKFGGSPTNVSNKMPLSPGDHTVVTNWWNRLMRDLQP